MANSGATVPDMPQRAAAFAAFTAKVPEKTQLIKARKAVTCAKCGGHQVAVGIHKLEQTAGIR
jgi:hypothetical protein